MFFRLKLALRLRDCLSRPYGEKPEKSQLQRSSATSFQTSEGESRTVGSDKQKSRSIARSQKPVSHSQVEGCGKKEGRSEGKSRGNTKSKLRLLAEDLTSENEKLRDAAVQSCYEISIDSADIRPLFLSTGIVEHLLKIAKSSKRNSRIFASLTLACLTSHEDCRAYLLKHGVVGLCLEQLDDPTLSDDVKGAWLRAIGRLAKFSEAAIEILKLKGLQTIVFTLLSGSDSLKRRALIALYFIGADKPTIQEAFIPAGAIKPLLELCNSPNAAVQLEAIDVCKVLSRCRACADIFVQESGIRKFVEAASEGSTKEIKNSAYRVLQRLCAHGTEISQLIVREGTNIAGCDLSEDGVEKLIDVFSTGVISLQEEAAKIVEELCETDPVASNELSQPSIVKSLITLLSSASPDGVAYAVNSLSHMLSDVNVKTKVIKEEGAIQALLATLIHGSERAADGAAASLEKLSSHREVAEEFVSPECIFMFLKAIDEKGDRVQLPISRILFYLRAVKACFLSNLVSCGGAKILVHRCWRGVPQVKVLCASLLADLCLEESHMEQVVTAGGICVLLHLERQDFRHGILETKASCAAALSRLELNPKMTEKVLNERRIQAQLTATLAMLERDQSIKLTPSLEEAIRMVPRHYFAPSSKEKSALSGKKITFQKSNLELPSLDIHVQILQALQIQKGQSVLELGCGTGYLLALSKYQAGNSNVLGIDGDQLATSFTRSALSKLNEERGDVELRPLVQRKPIPDFFSTAQRFDRIIVSVSFPKSLLGALRLLLRSNGQMVVPVEGQLLLIDKESGLHGARALCEYHPLKMLKQTYHSTRDPGGVVVVDPNRSCLPSTTDTGQSRLVSRIPRPESRISPVHSRKQGKSRIPVPNSAISRPARIQRESSARMAPRGDVQESRHRRKLDREGSDGNTPKASPSATQRSPTEEMKDKGSSDSFVERLRKEFEPYQMSMTDIKICRRPNGKKYRLGEGGFGTVYKAFMNNVDEVAVKVVRRQDPSKEEIESFLQEIKVLSSLRHRNIVQFYGACVNPPNTFFVTEMMKGGDLYTALRNHKDAMRWDRFGKKVALDIALGLNYLHSQKPPMMHRDLKTPNVLLSEEGNAKIADVGMVRAQDKERVTAQRIMTPLWAAPEVMRREKTSIKADIWSYGILIWEIATGEDIIEFQPLALSYIARPSSQPSTGRKMVMPDTIPDLPRRIFAECTKLNPDDRPEMKDIVQLLRRG